MKLVPCTFCLSALISVASSQRESDTPSCFPPVSPKGLSVHEEGALYVLDTAHGLQEYSALDGAFVGTLTDQPKSEGGVQVVGDNIFVSAASNSGGMVEKFDLTGTLLETFPSSSSDDDVELTAGGYDVAVAADGNVYVSNYLSDGVEVYDGSTGEHLMQVLGDTRALGIAFGPDGMLYAAINGEDEVRRFTTSSEGNLTLVDAFINGGSGSRTRSGPWGVTVNQDDYLVYVCWAGSQEVTEYSQSGAELRWWFPGESASAIVAGEDDDTSGAGSALSPLYVAVDGGGDVYVSAQVEDGGEADVFKYDGATGDEVGLLSSCWEVTEASSTETPQPSAAPSGSLEPLTTAPSGSLEPLTTAPSGSLEPLTTAPSGSLAPSTTAPSGSPAPSTGSGTPAPTSSSSSRGISSETPSPSPASTPAGSTTSPAETASPAEETASPAGETASPDTAEGEASSTNGAGGGGRIIPGFAFLVAFQVLMVMKMSGVVSTFVG